MRINLQSLTLPVEKKQFLKILAVTFVSALLAYNLLIIYGFTNPDGIMEGLTYYNNAVVASTMSGRWFVRYLSLLFGNIVNPFLEVSYFTLCATLSAILIGKMLQFKKEFSYYLTAIILLINAGTIPQATFLYMLKAYATCMLLCCIYAYYAFQKEVLPNLIAAVALALCFALYQSYVGMAAALIILRLVSELLREKKKIKETALDGVRALIVAVCGGIIYLIGMKIDLSIYGLNDSNRISEFSLQNILTHFLSSVKGTYVSYKNYFLQDTILKRRYLYLLLFAIFGVLFLMKAVKNFRENRKKEAVASVILLALLPFVSNLILVLIPTNPISALMNSQNMLFLPLLFAFSEEYEFKAVHVFTYGLTLVLSWTLILSANATYRCYQMSYQHINSQMAMILDDIYHTEGYEKDKTQIVIGGYIEDTYLRETNPLYHYALQLPKNVAFWEDTNGVTFNRRNYFTEYFGIDAQIVTEELYQYVILSDWFNEMPVWPAQGSVVYKDGLIAVKLTEYPHH